jgi:hypothetical protein
LDEGEHPIRFLTGGRSGRSESASAAVESGTEDEVDNNGASSRTDPDEEAEEYEEEHDEEQQEDPGEQSGEEVRPALEKEDTGPIPSKPVKPARAFMRKSAAFFRDSDTLKEMRMELRQEKKALTNQVHTLGMQLTEKEQVSAALKSELQQLKTSAALANVMRQAPKGSYLGSSPSGALKSLSKPKTATQWGERALDQKLENQCLAEELLALKTAVQDKQLAVQRKQKRRDEMSVKLSRVPRRYLCSLVDLQVEISRLLEEKRALESQSHLPVAPVDVAKAVGARLGVSNKTALQSELTGLEVTAERYKEQLRQWELKIDCENARLAPLQTRLAALQQELQRYEASHVLLRSVFLRLGPDSQDGCVSIDAALIAFQTLAPLDRPAITVEDMRVRLTEGGLASSDGELEPWRLSFTQFVEAFESLFKA